MAEKRLLKFDAVASIYDDTRALPMQIQSQIVSACTELFGLKGNTLEVGVGTGRIAYLLDRFGINTYGIDASRNMLDVFNRKMPGRSVCADAHAIPFASKRFSAVYMCDVLHLLESPWKALQECARVAQDYFVTISQFITFRDLRSNDPTEKNHFGIYFQRCADYGFTCQRWQGLEIPHLAQLVKPSRTITFPPFFETVTRTDALGAINTKSFTPQWDVPYELHTAVMRHLRKASAPTFERIWRCEVTVWSVSDIENYCRLQVG